MKLRITDEYAIICDDIRMRFDFTRLSDGFSVPSPLGGNPKSYPIVKERFTSLRNEKVNGILDAIFTLYYNEDGYEAKMVS